MGRPPKVEERSEEIMSAFEACVARKGLSATTLADVAAEAGLPRSLVRYFMGNRDEMVDRLIERIVARAEASFSAVRDQAGEAPLDELLDLFVGVVFANELSNTVVGELWYLARSDVHIRERLHGVYDYAIRLLTDAMRREGIGKSAKARRTAGFAVLSMVLGHSTLQDFGVTPPSRKEMRRVAEMIVAEQERTVTQ